MLKLILTMARTRHLLLIVITIFYVNAAPSDVSKLEEIGKVETAELEAKPAQLVDSESEDTSSPQGQRQKRWYDFGGFGFPPPISPVYPNFVKRDESQSTGVYGLVEDPFTQVFRRIQDIARQPPYHPPLPPQFPFYLPVLYLPCNCNPQNPSESNNNNDTKPDVNTRFPEMEDKRQNWGFVVDDDEDKDDRVVASRPINFDRIPPNRTLSRPPPKVDHGTVQGDGNDNTNNFNTQGSVPATTRRPAPQPPQNTNVPKTMNDLPTNCDAAVLSCCHRPEITFECFTSEGCPDASSYGNPCEPSMILRVIERFQKFYLQRTG